MGCGVADLAGQVDVDVDFTPPTRCYNHFC